MPQCTPTQCRSLVFRYFLVEGWLPAGTTSGTWRSVTVGQLRLDDPPLPSDGDLQKRRVALDLQHLFFILGSDLESPVEQLKDESLTLGDLATWCQAHQSA